MNILEKIYAHKREEVTLRKAMLPEQAIRQQALQAPPPADFKAALLKETSFFPRLIAEVKHKSPSKGILCEPFDPLMLALRYRKSGAAAVSVLTDHDFFGGSMDYLESIHRAMPEIPLLCKDFIYDPFQLYEARLAGASAVLLIVCMLEQEQLKSLYEITKQLNMHALVEVHNKTEAARALAVDAEIIGINNRDLKTFEVNLETTFRLKEHLDGNVIVSESGIHTSEDIHKLRNRNIHAVLIGEALVTAENPETKIKSLFGGSSS